MEEKTLDENRQGEFLMVEENASPLAPKNGKKLLLESYGCQMNFSDSEIVASILTKQGYTTTRDADEADLVLMNTCAIRDNAEQRVRGRLQFFSGLKKKTSPFTSWDFGMYGGKIAGEIIGRGKIG